MRTIIKIEKEYEIFSQNKKKNKKWHIKEMNRVIKILGYKVKPDIKYEYSKEDKFYVRNVDGPRAKSSIQLPLGSPEITMRYLALQVKVKPNKDFTITMKIRDDKNNHFNIAFTTVVRTNPERPSSSQTSALLNLNLPKGEWVTVYFDLELLSKQLWVSGTYHYLDSIEIAPTCTIRWVFAQDHPLLRNDDGEIVMPKGFEYQVGMVTQTILVPEVNREQAVRKSKIPTRTSSTSKPKTASTAHSASSNVLQVRKSTVSTGALKSVKTPNPPEVPIKVEDNNTEEEEEEEEDMTDAFGGAPPKIDDVSDIVINQGVPEGEEEELELVYIEALGCYYCPSLQKYYQIGDTT